jgi:hypothetical protein
MAVTSVYYMGILPKMALAVVLFSFSYGGGCSLGFVVCAFASPAFAVYVWNLCSFFFAELMPFLCVRCLSAHFFFLFFLVPSLFFPWLVSVTFNVHYPVLGCGPRMYCALC